MEIKIKKASLALLAILAFVTLSFNTSCSDDDDPVIDSPVVGTWVSYHSLLDITSTITFNANGTVRGVETFDGEDFVSNGTYTVSGNAIHIDWGDEQVTLRFTISGDTMTTTMDGEQGSTTWTRQ